MPVGGHLSARMKRSRLVDRLTRGRLRIEGLSLPVRIASVTLIATLIASAAVAVLGAFGTDWTDFGGYVPRPGVLWPRLAVLLMGMGLTIVAATAAAGSRL